MKKIKISLLLNIIIVIFTIFATVCMFTGFRFMHGPEVVLESSKLEMFKFFTVDSNIFMGIIALITAYYEFKIIKKDIKTMPKKIYLLKLMSTTAVGLTFIVVFTYLGPITEYGIKSMVMNSNLFFHLVTPVLSMITFMFFEKTDKLSSKDTFYGIIPMLLYAIYYVINIIIHVENGKVSSIYDWYWFVQNGAWTIIVVLPIIILITYLISFILWKVNKEK
ncbi:MAG: hypothetical protein IJG97_03295 [Bacilli bacterium]|nr:hypothetical protein [Bacilli bacterium]